MSLGDYTKRQQIAYLTAVLGGGTGLSFYMFGSRTLAIIMLVAVIAIESYLLGSWLTAERMKEKKWYSEDTQQ